MFTILTRNESLELMDRIGRGVRITGLIARYRLGDNSNTYDSHLPNGESFYFTQVELANLHTDLFNLRNA